MALLVVCNLGSAAWSGPVAKSVLPSAPQTLSCTGCGLTGTILTGGPRIGVASLLQSGPSLTLAAPAPALSPSLAAALPTLQAQAAAASQAPAPEAGPQTLTAVERSVALIDAARDEAESQDALMVLFERLHAYEREPVYPYPQAPTAETVQSLASAKAELSHAVAALQPALERSVLCGMWRGPNTTLNDSCCGDAAPKLGLLLRSAGHAVDVVAAQGHYFLLYRLPVGEIVVDPTIRQFFGGARAPPGIPTVFVGTVSDLHALFRRHAAAKTTRSGPSQIYFESSAVRNAKLQELLGKVQGQPDSSQYEPLREAIRKTGGLPQHP